MEFAELLVGGIDPGEACSAECDSDAILLLLGHLRKKRKNYSSVLRLLTFDQIRAMLSRYTIGLRTAPACRSAVRWLAVCAHDSSARRDSVIQHRLADVALIEVLRQSHAIALPVRARPFRLCWECQPRNVLQKFSIASRHSSPVLNCFRKPLQLFTPDRCLNVSQSIVEPQLRVRLKHYGGRGMPNRVGHAHAMLTPQAKFAIDAGIRGRKHSSVPGRQSFTRM